MEKQIFMALGLHLLPEPQLFWLIFLIGVIELFILYFIMWIKNFFLEWFDLVYLSTVIYCIDCWLFWDEHLTFFSTLFYINVYLLIVFVICRMFKIEW